MSARRCVLFLIPTLTGGGAERVIVTLLRHLDRSRLRLVLIVVTMRDAVYRNELPEDVEVIDLNRSRVRFALPAVVRLIWRKRPDVVFSTLGHLNLALAMIRPLLPDSVRYIGREACVVSEILKEQTQRGAWDWGYRRLYPRFDVVVCQSLDMRDDLIERFAFPPAKAVIIHNPLDIERVRRLARERIPAQWAWCRDAVPHLVAAGRLSHQKGFDLLIEALALVEGACPHLTLLGEGPLRGALEQLAADRGVRDRVHFAGFQRNPYPFFAHADAFVLSSRYEGFPNVMLEALACGTPVIATPAPGGVAEIAALAGGVTLASAVGTDSLRVAIEQFLSRCRESREPLNLAPFEVSKIVGEYQQLLMD